VVVEQIWLGVQWTKWKFFIETFVEKLLQVPETFKTLLHYRLTDFRRHFIIDRCCHAKICQEPTPKQFHLWDSTKLEETHRVFLSWNTTFQSGPQKFSTNF